ncbi:MAG: cation-translocating P-type ATPase [archaeon]|nr:cation-translocating P-type ATPase [archaeon]
MIDIEFALPILVLISVIAVLMICVVSGFSSHEYSPSAMKEILLVVSTSMMFMLLLGSLANNSIAGYLPWISVAVCGLPIVVGAVIAVIKEHDITADVLVSIAIVASCFIGEIEAAAEISIIMQIGAFLEEATVSKANKEIAGLHSMKVSNAHLIRDGKEYNVQLKSVAVGDVVRVYPGEIIPVDGTVVEGHSSIDASSLTGESVPIDVSVGSRVMSGTVNMFGSMDIIVDRVGKDSTAERMARLLDEADAGRSKIVRTADKWASVIVLLALSISILTYLFTGDAYRAVTVLVVFCPCALILATPTAIMGAAGNMSRHGILMKDGGAVERLAKVDKVLFDKTGTITTGIVECKGFESVDDLMTAEEIAVLASAVEDRSEHPLGKAIADYCVASGSVEEFEYVPGLGVMGKVDGKAVCVGNRRFLEERCPENFEAVSVAADRIEAEGSMAVLVGVEGRSVGVARLSDSVKSTSAYAVRHLWMLGLQRILLTGDSKERASRMRDELKMDDAVWECLPSDKMDIVSKIDCEGNTCMIGDGINDAPSLRRAGVGITLGGVGSDLAVESSDIVFMNDDLSKLPALIRLCRRTLKTIKLGIAFSLGINLIATVLAVLGYLGPVGGALVHNIGSVMVIIAAAMVLRYDPWSPGVHKVRGSSATSKN